MIASATTVVSTLLAGDDGGTGGGQYAGWKHEMDKLSGGILVTCLILAVVALLLAAVAFVYGKVGGNAKAAEIGIEAFPWLLFGAAVMGSASWVVAWGSKVL